MSLDQMGGPLELFALLRWLDGSPLLDMIEPYRRRIFERAFSVDDVGQPLYSLVLAGRAKKNGKSLDLVLAGTASLLLREPVQGADGYLLANDEDQAGDDLDLAKKLIRANPVLESALVVRSKEIERRDGRGMLVILPARDVAGAHGKTAAFIGYDEIHEYRDYALLEALSPDPTRRDVLTWITSYDSIFHTPGRPLWDYFLRGKRGEDSRMFFDWHSGTYCTCPDGCEGRTEEERANPSMASWTNPHYLDEQKRRLPSHKFRRLHLNIGGQPDGAALSAEKVLAAVVTGRKSLPRVPGTRYVAYVDMSGGSNDDATLAIAHCTEAGVHVLDVIVNQGGRPPFDPRAAVTKFAGIVRTYGLPKVTGDAYAGQTFRLDFEREGISYTVATGTTSDHYEALEPHLNAGEVELLDAPTLIEQLVGLVVRGEKVTHVPGEHDDFSCAAAGALVLASEVARHGAYGEWDPWTGDMVSGWDSQGREWRGGDPWNGTFEPDRDSCGRPLAPVRRYIDGVPQPWTPADWALVTAPKENE